MPSYPKDNAKTPEHPSKSLRNLGGATGQAAKIMEQETKKCPSFAPAFVKASAGKKATEGEAKL